MRLIINDVDLDSFGRSDLSTSQLDLFNEIDSIRTGLSIFGNGPLLSVGNVFIGLSRNGAIITKKKHLFINKRYESVIYLSFPSSPLLK